MTPFGALVALGFRRWSTYRLATAAGAFTNTVFGLIKAAITIGVVGAAGGSLGGYDTVGVATYAWLTQAIIAPVHVFGWNELALRVRTGDIAVDLARPVDPQLASLAGDVGRAAFVVLPRGLPPLLVGALVTGLALPRSLAPYALGAVALGLAVLLSFACRWLVNTAAFWMLEVRGVVMLYVTSMNLLSGLVIPVRWFPGWLRAVAEASPFPSMVQVPVDVLMGRVTGPAAWSALATQGLWLVVLLVAGHLALRAGARRLVVQGG